ncbi:MAG: trypsin-like peptidase domain-containing protein [Rhizobiaceae bacterium]|nr:trypsin-like peptidase domain-containing protein [Rhizobiaceae bacterium]
MRRAAGAMLAVLYLATSSAAMEASTREVSSLSAAYNEGTDVEFRIGMQMRLAWVGDYRGSFDGRIESSGLRAIRDFQARHGMEASGIIDEHMLELLIRESDRAESAAGFQLVDDVSTGVKIGLPLALVAEGVATELGRVWRSSDGEIEIETIRMLDGKRPFGELYEMLRRSTAVRTVTAESFDGDFFTIAGRESQRIYLMRFSAKGADVRGFSVSYADAAAGAMAPVATVMANLFDPYALDPAGLLVAGEQQKGTSPGSASATVQRSLGLGSDIGGRSLLEAGIHAERSPPAAGHEQSGADETQSSGSGFVVSSDGWVLTNAHVAGACQTVLVGDHGPADAVVLDADNDLALVHVSGALGAPLAMAVGVPRLGEDVLALGYPLRSILADSLNVTRGNVSSLLGLMNDPRYLQISAPIQPGNSGGPLVDLAGRVVGVVTAKLNAVAVADATGDIPQSINFAIRPDAAIGFLEANGIDFVTADATLESESVADTTERVQDSVLPILCLGET